MESEGCLDEVVRNIEIGLVQQEHISAKHNPRRSFHSQTSVHWTLTKSQPF